MTQNSRWRKTSVAVVLAAFVLVVQAGLMAQNLGTAPQVNVAVQGEQATQPEGTFGLCCLLTLDGHVHLRGGSQILGHQTCLNHQDERGKNDRDTGFPPP